MAALVATVAGLASFAQAGQRISPGRAAQAFPLDGDARGSAATVRYALAQARAEDPFIVPAPGIVAEARTAYLQEPITPGSIVILARAEAVRSAKDATAILITAHALSRRSTVLNNDLISAYGKAGDADSALPLIDEILRRETAAHGVLLERLAMFAGNPAIGTKILDLLALDAPWGPQFWRQLAQSPAGLANAANLRLAHAKNGGASDPEIDRMLVEGLAGQARFSDAARLAKGLFPAAASIGDVSSGELLRNPRFADKPDILPFDWRLTSSGDFGAGRLGGGEGIIVSALGGSRGVVVEQLVALPNAPLRLSGKVDSADPEDRTRLMVSLDCAKSSRTIFSGSAAELPARIAAPSCRWAWVRLSVRLPSEADGRDWTVRAMSLRPARP